MAGCGCSIDPNDAAIRRNRAAREATDAELYAALKTTLDRLDGLARRPLVGFFVFSLGLRDRERQQLTGLEYGRLLAMAGEPVPEGIQADRMVWVPIDTFRRLLDRAEARRSHWDAVGGSTTAAA